MDTSKFLDFYYLPQHQGIAIKQHEECGLYSVSLWDTHEDKHLNTIRVFDGLEGAQRCACREASAVYRAVANDF
jgi:hypothetical protein